MAVDPKAVQSLDQRFPITDPQSGKPSDYFMQYLFARNGALTDVDQAITDIQNNKADKSTEIIAGTGLSGGGDLSADRTLNLNAGINLLTDVDTATTPPTNGQALVWDNTNSLWKPGSVAGGSGGYLSFTMVPNNTLTTYNVNRTTYDYLNYWPISQWIDLAYFPFTQYQLRVQGQSNAAGQTVTLALVSATATGYANSGAADLVITNTLAHHSSGWITRDDGHTTGRRYVVSALGSNTTVDLAANSVTLELRV